MLIHFCQVKQYLINGNSRVALNLMSLLSLDISGKNQMPSLNVLGHLTLYSLNVLFKYRFHGK